MELRSVGRKLPLVFIGRPPGEGDRPKDLENCRRVSCHILSARDLHQLFTRRVAVKRKQYREASYHKPKLNGLQSAVVLTESSYFDDRKDAGRSIFVTVVTALSKPFVLLLTAALALIGISHRPLARKIRESPKQKL
jgi:hypothetical protein